MLAQLTRACEQSCSWTAWWVMSAVWPLGRGVGSRMGHKPFRLQGSRTGSTAWCGEDQESQPGLVQGEQWWWLAGCPVQPSIKINWSCSWLPGPGETQAFVGPFGCCSNLQSKKPDGKSWMCFSTWGQKCRKSLWRTRGCVQMASVAKGRRTSLSQQEPERLLPAWVWLFLQLGWGGSSWVCGDW